MNSSPTPRLLDWGARLAALAQTGLTFSHDPYDIERYQALRGLAAEMLAIGTGTDAAAMAKLLAADTGYATPKIDVRGVVLRDAKILLVRERSDGRWTLPGGWADVNASPAENVVREIFEESGFQTRAEKLLAVFDRSKHPHEPIFPFHVYKLFLRCEIIGGVATHSSETDGVEFFAEQELPELSRTRITEAQIHRMFEHHRNPALPADFD